jgi:inhibitor of KinA
MISKGISSPLARLEEPVLNDSSSYPSIQPVGDSALLVALGDRVDLALNRRVHALAQLLNRDAPTGMGEAVPTYVSVLLHYDPLVLSESQARAWSERCLERSAAEPLPEPRRVPVPTVYGGDYGPDLEFVAAHNDLSPAEVIQIHSSVEYPVYMMGFTPGFPYLGGMDPRIAAPRLTTPRTRVPAGSVGIAGEQTGIYSFESPGGWRLIGFTPLRLFQPERTLPSLLVAGDLITFVPIEEKELAHVAERT